MSFKIFIYFEVLNINFTTFKDFVFYEMWLSDLFEFLEDDRLLIGSISSATPVKFTISITSKSTEGTNSLIIFFWLFYTLIPFAIVLENFSYFAFHSQSLFNNIHKVNVFSVLFVVP